MSNPRQGVLIYDGESGRFDIRFSLEEYYGGLHCGTCFEVLVPVHGACGSATPLSRTAGSIIHGVSTGSKAATRYWPMRWRSPGWKMER